MLTLEDVHQGSEAKVSASFDGALWKLIGEIISGRLLTWCALLGTIGAFAWVMADPHIIRLVAATVYTILVYLPLVWRRDSK